MQVSEEVKQYFLQGHSERLKQWLLMGFLLLTLGLMLHFTEGKLVKKLSHMLQVKNPSTNIYIYRHTHTH